MPLRATFFIERASAQHSVRLGPRNGAERAFHRLADTWGVDCAESDLHGPLGSLGRTGVGADLGMIIDVVNDWNQPIGQARRGEVLGKGLGFRTVHIFLFDTLGRLLMQRLPDDHGRSPGRLGSSVAGYLNAGESYHEAAERKLNEELRINTDVSHVGTWQMRDGRSSKFVALFTGAVVEDPDFDRREISELVYMDLDDLNYLMQQRPEAFTHTFIFVYDRYKDRLYKGS
jgi:isopentenyl-diphosphate delta-isomerase